MRDNTLETHLRLLTLQVESWKKLHDFITYALDKSKPIISADQERQFTEIRGILLQETEHVFNELEPRRGTFRQSDECPATSRLDARRARTLRSKRPAVSSRTGTLSSPRSGVMQGQLKSRRKELLGRSVLTQYSRATVWPQAADALALPAGYRTCG